MSDPKRATLITVGAPKSAKKNVNKTVRLTINLVESNESKYPELNYKELVIAEERKKKVENGKTPGLDPFSDNDDDVARVARKFEQKYGGKSTYGRTGRSKHDDFADIGAGYDENDSFIDNTHGYDEMIPPECDTLYGGFYINCGSLEFKTVENQVANHSDGEPGNRRNKRRMISSSSSDQDSSESSSESSQDVKDKPVANGEVSSHNTEHRKKLIEAKCQVMSRTHPSSSESSQDVKDKPVANGEVSSHNTEHRKKVRWSSCGQVTWLIEAKCQVMSRTLPSSSESSQDVKDKPVANGEVSSHNTEHRKKKNKNIDKKKAKKVRRTDSSAANSGKQTSDDNAHGDGESADSRTSQSDSLTSKPAPSSENAATSDSSRDAEKVEVKLPPSVVQVLEDLEAVVNRNFVETPNLAAKELEAKTDQYLIRLERVLSKNGVDPASTKAAWTRAARCLGSTRSKLHQRVKSRPENHVTTEPPPPAPAAAQSAASKRKADDDDDEDFSRLTAAEREAKIVETLQRLKLLIEERKPDMISNYNAECARVQEEKKKLQVASAVEGAPVVEKRLPKRRFPWCPRSRALLVRLKRLAGSHEAAATLLAKRALPLFPNGFVRMPTLLRQADLSKDIKASDVKRQRLGSASQPAPPAPPAFVEPIHFPSSLTVTTTTNPPAPAAPPKEEDKYKPNSVLGTFFNLNKDLIVERPEDRKNDRVKDDVYVPPNNIGSITITPVIPAQKDKKPVVPDKPKEGLIRVKSPAALNEMVKKEKAKKPEKTNHVKEKRMDTPLHIDTNLQPSKKDPSPKKDEISPKQIETMRITENNIPRPALVPVRHSPTFAKPDKRPPEVKKKKDVVIVSDVDPLGDVQAEPFAVDDSSSDVELVEDSKNTDKSEPKIGDNKSDTVPSKDKVSDSKKVNSVKHKERSSKETKEKRSDSLDETTKEIDNVMREIREMQNSQEPTKLNSTSYAGVITSAQNELL